MKSTVAILLGLLLGFCTRQAEAAQCVPGWFQQLIGTGYCEKVFEDPAGKARYLWIQDPTTRVWYLGRYAVLNRVYDSTKIDAIRAVVQAASSPIEGIRQAVAQFSVPPLGPQETYDFNRLVHFACTEGNKDRPAGVDPVPCGDPPSPPVSVALIVGPATRTDGTRPAYRYENGARAVQVTPGATAGQPCDAGKVFEVTAAGVWAPFGPDYRADIGALCVKP